jgi:hypothetical protein
VDGACRELFDDDLLFLSSRVFWLEEEEEETDFFELLVFEIFVRFSTMSQIELKP